MRQIFSEPYGFNFICLFVCKSDFNGIDSTEIFCKAFNIARNRKSSRQNAVEQNKKMGCRLFNCYFCFCFYLFIYLFIYSFVTTDISPTFNIRQNKL